MRKLKDSLREHTVFLCAVCSALLAIIIHILFKVKTGPEWLKAEWEAGDILTYTSTVSLGLLALWQNKRFKEENDASQARLEKLTERANEMSAINKIIEIESDRLARLKEAIDAFSIASDTETLISIFKPDKNQSLCLDTSISSNAMKVENTIEKTFARLMRELNHEVHRRTNDNNKFIIICFDYYTELKEVLNRVSRMKSDFDFKSLDELSKLRHSYDVEKAYVIQEKERKLDQVLYGSVTLLQIQEMYYKEKTERNSFDTGKI